MLHSLLLLLMFTDGRRSPTEVGPQPEVIVPHWRSCSHRHTRPGDIGYESLSHYTDDLTVVVL